MRTVCYLIAAATFFELQDRASAEAPQEGPTLVYRSPEGCPSGENFMQRIRSRLGPSRTAAAGGRTLNVQIAISDRGYRGKLSLLESDGRAMTKSLEGRDCEALVDALSLVAALAVESDNADDTARVDSRVTPAPSPAPPSGPPPGPVASGAPLDSSDRVEHVDSVDHVDHVRASATAPRSRMGLELGGLLAVGAAPTPIYGGTLSFVWFSLGEGWFCPAFQLGAAGALGPDLTETSGTARFAWLTVRGAAYLLRWRLGQGVVVRAGAIGDVGVLLARGIETLSPTDSSRGWLSLGVAASLEVPLGPRLTVRPLLGVETPLRRDRYAFGSTDFFEVPLAVATGSVSIVANF